MKVAFRKKKSKLLGSFLGIRILADAVGGARQEA